MVESAPAATAADETGKPAEDSPRARFLSGLNRGLAGDKPGIGAHGLRSGRDGGPASAARPDVAPVDSGVSSPALRERFQAGRRRGLDPTNQATTGAARTTLNADWIGRDCSVCRHTFRFDDLVYVEYTETGRIELVRHHTPSLPCSDKVVPEPPPSREVTDRFFAGIDRANPPEMATVLLHADHPLVAPRRERQKCRFCGDTFRPLESAIVCPCRPDQPMCQSGLHRDPRRGLLCYDEWTKSIKLAKCLMDPRRPLPDRPQPAPETTGARTTEAVAEAITQVVHQVIDQAAERIARGQTRAPGGMRLNVVFEQDPDEAPPGLDRRDR
jgi:hypothetical protein